MTDAIIYQVNDDLGNQIDVTNSQLENVRIISQSDQKIVFELNNQIHELEIVNQDNKAFTVIFNNIKHKLVVKDQLDILIESLGMKDADTENEGELIAPMPGLVLEIHIEEGDEVEADVPAITLEAMKMENMLMTPKAGVVKKIHAETNASVEKNQLLVEIE